ncbi:hypothetical protein [Corynebacterium glyciniphilum]|uniref:hypothetical protein n=1 Tax=Corynebacterium glyciniphilum TaxID=1404244 RepID=UPI003DA0CF08
MDPAQVLDLVTATVGDLRQYGLPSAEGAVIGQTHPIVSNTILHALSHGMISHRPDLARIDGDTVEFVDGRTVRPDVIVFATGHGLSYPFLDDGMVSYHRGHPRLHLGTFVTGGFPFADVARDVTQADGYTVLVTVPRKIESTFGLALPRGFDEAEFYVDVPRRSEPAAVR